MFLLYRRCWEYLVWVDPANYAGVLGKAPQDLAEMPIQSNEADNEESDDNDDSEVSSSFQ